MAGPLRYEAMESRVRSFLSACVILVIVVLPFEVQGMQRAASEVDGSYSLLRADIDKAFVSAASDVSSGQMRSEIAHSYATRIHRYQKESRLSHLSDGDLSLLRRAALEAYADTNVKYILDDFLLDVAEITHRGLGSSRIYRDEVYAYVQARMFDEARKVASEHPEAGIASVPKVSTEEGFNRNNPAILIWRPESKDFLARNVDLRKLSLVVVGHPLCHFTQRAVFDISREGELEAVTKGALWVLPQDGNLDSALLSQWNASHPGQAMAAVYLESSWPGFSYWGTPTFYFLKNGAVERSVIGWPSGGNGKALLVGNGG
jgi:hypothetical protein